MNFIKQYGFSLFVFLVIDFAWIFLVANNAYTKEIPNLMREKFLIIPAFLFYIIFTLSLYFLVIGPALGETEINLLNAVLRGFVFGFAAYSTFALTNRSVLEGWTLLITVSDMLWGGVLSAIITYFTVLVFK